MLCVMLVPLSSSTHYEALKQDNLRSPRSHFVRSTFVHAVLMTSADSSTFASWILTLPSRRRFDYTGRIDISAANALKCGRRGHRMQLREPESDGGLSIFSRFGFHPIDGG